MEVIIKRMNLTWNGTLQPLDNSKLDSLCIHHLAHPTWGLLDTHLFHKEGKGWAGFAYGFLVLKNGEIWEGRGFNKCAGVLDHNDHVFSVAFQGNFDTEMMPQAQLQAGKKLVEYCLRKLPTIKIVDGHSRWTATSCPGKNFPIAELRRPQKGEGVKQGEPVVTSFADALDVMREKGIVKSPEYWLRLGMVGGEVNPEYIRNLFIKIANTVQGRG